MSWMKWGASSRFQLDAGGAVVVRASRPGEDGTQPDPGQRQRAHVWTPDDSPDWPTLSSAIQLLGLQPQTRTEPALPVLGVRNSSAPGSFMTSYRSAAMAGCPCYSSSSGSRCSNDGSV